MRQTVLAGCGRCFFSGREFHVDPICREHGKRMLKVDTSKLLPIEQAPKDGTWIWAYYPPVPPPPGPRRGWSTRGVPEKIVPARWGTPHVGNYVPHWLITGIWTPGPDPTHFFPMTQPPMIEE
ncbi:hypothetical protein [Methylobacterium indicum]|uniref:Uncharacterized protein n=1 Tax=Methylobacterium indicum TaxID=1775910 RepID=A0A8H9CA50_9HYPH|nr:hypothetical protein [Methylobacterium indicum]BCM87771.1 hypothetical protein mvi_62320 [Methylobacterium indicum]